MKNLTAETFKEKIFDFSKETEWSFKSSKPAIIDFYADWCSPCKAIAPVLDELNKEYQNIDFYKVDTDAENEIASAFNIKNIPSILFIPLTGMPQMSLGAMPKEIFKKIIKEVLGIE
jgi:thioredoxin